MARSRRSRRPVLHGAARSARTRILTPQCVPWRLSLLNLHVHSAATCTASSLSDRYRNQVPTAPAAGAKKSGWYDEQPAAAVKPAAPSRRRKSANDDDEEASSVTTQSIAKMESVDDDDGPSSFIPDLEDEEEQLTLTVAQAPSLKSSRVQTIRELDEEIDMALPSTSEIGVDLSVLQSFLTPQQQVLEEDVPWNFNLELQTIASEMQREHEERESATLPGQTSPKKKKSESFAAGSSDETPVY